MDFKVTLKQKSYGELVLLLDHGPHGRLFEAFQLSIASLSQTVVSSLRVPLDAVSINPNNWHSRGGDLDCISRAVLPSIVSNGTRHVISCWLSKCAKHVRCRLRSDQAIPTELLDVKEPSQPKLIQTKDMQG